MSSVDVLMLGRIYVPFDYQFRQTRRLKTAIRLLSDVCIVGNGRQCVIDHRSISRAFRT